MYNSFKPFSVVSFLPKVHRLQLIYLLIWPLLLAYFMSEHAQAAKCEENKTQTDSLKVDVPYCGVHSLYAAMRFLGKEIDFRKLVKPEYIGGCKGSSLAELVKAAKDNGMYAIPVGNLTCRELRKLKYPAILHVKRKESSEEYDHYELFLGTQNKLLRLFDAPGPLRLVPFYELVTRWDGTAVIVADRPIDVSVCLSSTKIRYVIYAIIATIATLIFRWYYQRRMSNLSIKSIKQLLSVSITQCTGLLFAAILLGLLHHFIDEEGFLANSNATVPVQQVYLSSYLPKLDVEDVQKSLSDKKVLFIDARYAEDFEQGHIDGAINIPVNADPNQWRDKTAEIPQDIPIVVYCQSKGCPFAKKVAIRLMENGFVNIKLFKEGWEEWVITQMRQSN